MRNLMKRDRFRPAKKKMLENTEQILISELVLATELEEGKGPALLDGAFA